MNLRKKVKHAYGGDYSKEEIYEMMGKTGVGKAMRPDGVSAHILKECRKQLIKPVYYIIKGSLKTGRVPKKGKREDIVPFYKNGKK